MTADQATEQIRQLKSPFNMENKKIRLLIADDHQVLLDGLVMMLQNETNLEVVSTAPNGQEVINQLATLQIDVLLMDIQMPIMDGYEAAQIIREKHPNVKVIILSMHSERVFVEKMYSTGISGYLLKSAGKDEILQAIEKVNSGSQYFSSEITATLLSQNTNKSTSITTSQLTKREKEILGLISTGLTNPEIAKKLFLSTDTIKTHRKNMMRKLNLNNTAGLVKYALEHKSSLG